MCHKDLLAINMSEILPMSNKIRELNNYGISELDEQSRHDNNNKQDVNMMKNIGMLSEEASKVLETANWRRHRSKRFGIKQSLEKLSVKYVPHNTEVIPRFEHVCSPCSREHVVTEASSYCPECEEKLCSICTLQHRKFQILKTHTILGVHEAPRKKDPVKEKRLPKLTESCGDHAGKLLDLFCTDHDFVGCSACIAINHKHCPTPVYISKTAVGVSKTDLPKETRDDLSKVKTSVFMLKFKRMGDKKRYRKEKDDILKEIHELKVRIIGIFDKLEEAVQEKLTQKFKTDMKVIKSDIKQCEDAIASLEDSLSKLNANSDAQLFINIKRNAKNSIEKGNFVISTVSNNIGKETVTFKIDKSIEEWIKNLSGIGKFDHEQSIFTGAFYGKTDVNLKSDPDNTDYVLNGSVNLPGGNTILCDWKNKRLKLMDTAYRLRCHCDVLGMPYSVCYVRPNLIATTLRDEKIVQFVEVQNMKMKLEKRFKIDEYCRGIACKQDMVYITCGGGEGEIHGQLRVYSMSGMLIKVYEEDVQGKPLFKSPKDIIINDECTRIFVSDRKGGIVILTIDGRLVSMFNDPGLKTPLGLCMDGKSNLFACGYDSNNIVQFTSDGKRIGEVITDTEGLERPLTICCHESANPRIIVASEGSYTIKVFTLQERFLDTL